MYGVELARVGGILSHPATKAFLDGWERVFAKGKKKKRKAKNKKHK